MDVLLDNILSFLSSYSSEIISLFGLIVSYLVLREAVKMRRLNVDPEIIYYVSKIDRFHHAILENIGNGVAYDVKCKIEFDSEVEKPFLDPKIDVAREVEREFENLAPGQKLIFKMGNIALSEKLIGFDTHTAKISYKKGENKKHTNRSFTINKSTIVHLDDKANLKTIADRLEKIEKKLEPYKNLISIKSDK